MKDNNKCVILTDTHGVEPDGTAQRYSSAQKKSAHKLPYSSQRVQLANGWRRPFCYIGSPLQPHRQHLPLYEYAIDVCIANAWLEYKLDCKALGEKAMLLKPFCMSVGNALNSAGDGPLPC